MQFLTVLRLNRAAKFIGRIILLAIYLNIGWAFAEYGLNYLFETPYEELTLTGKVLSGAGVLADRGQTKQREEKPILLTIVVFAIFVILWPSFILLSLLFWAGWLIYMALWYVVLGGIYKTFFQPLIFPPS